MARPAEPAGLPSGSRTVTEARPASFFQFWLVLPLLGECMLGSRESRFGMGDAIAAQIALLRAAWDIRTRRTGGLLSSLPESGNSSTPDPAPTAGRRGYHEREERRRRSESGSDLAEARRVGDAVCYVATRGLIRPRCLVQALALKRLLDRRGLTGGRIRVGVREEGGELLAHAWVDFRGHVVGDFPEHVQRYTDFRGLLVRPDDRDAAREEGGGDPAVQ